MVILLSVRWIAYQMSLSVEWSIWKFKQIADSVWYIFRQILAVVVGSQLCCNAFQSNFAGIAVHLSYHLSPLVICKPKSLGNLGWVMLPVTTEISIRSKTSMLLMFIYVAIGSMTHAEFFPPLCTLCPTERNFLFDPSTFCHFAFSQPRTSVLIKIEA